MSERGLEEFLSRSNEEKRKLEPKNLGELNELDKQRADLLNQRAEIKAKKSLFGNDPAEDASLNRKLEQLDGELDGEIEKIIQKMRGLGADWV